LIEHLLDELDKSATLLGLVLALTLTAWLTLAVDRPIYRMVGVLSSIVCAVYLIIRKFMSLSILSSEEYVSSRLCLALNVLFFLLFAYSILCFHLRPDLYTRPLGYFIAIALMASVAAVEILILPCRKWCSHFALFKIVLIGLSLEFSQLSLYPSILGKDPWWHQMFTLKILNLRYIPEGSDYSQLPLMHLMVGLTSLVTGLNFKMATMLSVSLPQVLCDVLFTFLLGSFLFNNKVGLLGGLLLSVADTHIKMGHSPIPTTMATVFIPFILYLVLKLRREKPHIGISLAIFLMGSLILTHTVTAMCMTVLLFLFWAGLKVYNWAYHGWKKPITLTIFSLFSVAMFSWWTYASGHLRQFAELIKYGFSMEYFRRIPMPEEVIQYAYNVPFSEQLLQIMGLLIFTTVSFIGCLCMVSRRFRNSYRFATAMGGVTITAINFLAEISGRSIILDRWWYFSEILLALPLALAFLLFCSIVKKKLWKSVLLATLTFSLSFLTILTPLANFDNRTFSPNTLIRFAFTKSELDAVEAVSSMQNRTMGVDTYYSDLRWSAYPMEDISWEIYMRNYSNCQDMFILIREDIVNYPLHMISYTYKLHYDPRETLTIQGFSKVYDCGSVSGFVYSGPG